MPHTHTHTHTPSPSRRAPLAIGTPAVTTLSHPSLAYPTLSHLALTLDVLHLAWQTELNINSAIAYPGHLEVVPLQGGEQKYTVKGYCYTGGGRKVIRVNR